MLSLSNLVVLWRQLVVNVSYQCDAHLSRVVAPQHVADEVRLDLHLYHLKRATEHTAENIGIPELILGSAVVGQFDKVGEGILIEDQRELLAVARPVCYGGGDVEEDFEADLEVLVRVEGNSKGEGELAPTFAIISAVSRKLEHRRIVLDLAR